MYSRCITLHDLIIFKYIQIYSNISKYVQIHWNVLARSLSITKYIYTSFLSWFLLGPAQRRRVSACSFAFTWCLAQTSFTTKIGNGIQGRLMRVADWTTHVLHGFYASTSFRMIPCVASLWWWRWWWWQRLPQSRACRPTTMMQAW